MCRKWLKPFYLEQLNSSVCALSRDRRQLLLIVLSEFEWINFFPPWSHPTFYGVLVISGGRENISLRIILAKFAHDQVQQWNNSSSHWIKVAFLSKILQIIIKSLFPTILSVFCHAKKRRSNTVKLSRQSLLQVMNVPWKQS